MLSNIFIIFQRLISVCKVLSLNLKIGKYIIWSIYSRQMVRDICIDI